MFWRSLAGMIVFTGRPFKLPYFWRAWGFTSLYLRKMGKNRYGLEFSQNSFEVSEKGHLLSINTILLFRKRVRKWINSQPTLVLILLHILFIYNI